MIDEERMEFWNFYIKKKWTNKNPTEIIQEWRQASATLYLCVYCVQQWKIEN